MPRHGADRRHHRHRRRGARSGADALHRRARRHWREAGRRGAGPAQRRHRGRSARGDEPLLDRRGRTRSRCWRRRSKGGLLHAPDLYMEKLVVGPSSKHAVSLDAPVSENLRAIARSPRARRRGSGRDRPRSAAARGAHRADPGHRRADPPDLGRRPLGRHRRGGRRQRRARGDGHGRRARRRADRRGDALPERRDLRAPRRRRRPSTRRGAGRWASPTSDGSTRRAISRRASSIIFAATGVTDGALMKGVRFFGDGTRTSSLVMQSNPARIRFVDTIHVEQSRMVRVRFCLSSWRKNLFAVTAASFIGFTGFTLVMPFLPLYFQLLGVQRRRRDCPVVGSEPRRHAGAHRAAVAVLGPARRSLRPQDHGRALALQLRHRHGGDGVRDPAVARLRPACRAGAVRRLRRADPHHGGRLGAARSDGVGHRHRPDRAAARSRPRPDHRRRASRSSSACATRSS